MLISESPALSRSVANGVSEGVEEGVVDISSWHPVRKRQPTPNREAAQ
tara:strand:- start:157 stop:300 length:144 start_codon:yes stop_codon:yes gene_type:complete